MATRLAAKARKIADHDGVAALGPSSMGFRTPTPDEKQSLLQFCTGVCRGRVPAPTQGQAVQYNKRQIWGITTEVN